jgi:hypothetical protein
MEKITILKNGEFVLGIIYSYVGWWFFTDSILMLISTLYCPHSVSKHCPSWWWAGLCEAQCCQNNTVAFRSIGHNGWVQHKGSWPVTGPKFPTLLGEIFNIFWPSDGSVLAIFSNSVDHFDTGLCDTWHELISGHNTSGHDEWLFNWSKWYSMGKGDLNIEYFFCLH